jgi:hypothetical protein
MMNEKKQNADKKCFMINSVLHSFGVVNGGTHPFHAIDPYRRGAPIGWLVASFRTDLI